MAEPEELTVGLLGPFEVAVDSRPVAPRQLPADIDGFASRQAALKALGDLISERDGQDGHAVVISAIAGTAGGATRHTRRFAPCGVDHTRMSQQRTLLGSLRPLPPKVHYAPLSSSLTAW